MFQCLPSHSFIWSHACRCTVTLEACLKEAYNAGVKRSVRRESKWHPSGIHSSFASRATHAGSVVQGPYLVKCLNQLVELIYRSVLFHVHAVLLHVHSRLLTRLLVQISLQGYLSKSAWFLALCKSSHAERVAFAFLAFRTICHSFEKEVSMHARTRVCIYCSRSMHAPVHTLQIYTICLYIVYLHCSLSIQAKYI
jgi:hypothetical protein